MAVYYQSVIISFLFHYHENYMLEWEFGHELYFLYISFLVKEMGRLNVLCDSFGSLKRLKQKKKKRCQRIDSLIAGQNAARDQPSINNK